MEEESAEAGVLESGPGLFLRSQSASQSSGSSGLELELKICKHFKSCNKGDAMGGRDIMCI